MLLLVGIGDYRSSRENGDRTARRHVWRTVSGGWPAVERSLRIPRAQDTPPRNAAQFSAAERGLRGIALGRKSWLFAGSDRGGARAAAIYTLIGTAKLNDVDPQAWLADVLGRIADTPQTRLDELLPWNWAPRQKLDRAA